MDKLSTLHFMEKAKKYKKMLDELIKEYETKVGNTELNYIETTAIAGFLKKLYLIKREVK